MDIDEEAIPLVITCLRAAFDQEIDQGESFAMEVGGYRVEVKRREPSYFDDIDGIRPSVHLSVERLK